MFDRQAHVASKVNSPETITQDNVVASELHRAAANYLSIGLQGLSD